MIRAGVDEPLAFEPSPESDDTASRRAADGVAAETADAAEEADVEEVGADEEWDALTDDQSDAALDVDEDLVDDERVDDTWLTDEPEQPSTPELVSRANLLERLRREPIDAHDFGALAEPVGTAREVAEPDSEAADATEAIDAADAPVALEERTGAAGPPPATDTIATETDTDTAETDATEGAPETDLSDPLPDAEGTPELTVEELQSAIEAILFSTAEPITVRQLAEVFEASVHDVREAVERLRQDLLDTQRAFRLAEVAGGLQLLSLPRFHRWIIRFRRKRKEQRLSAAALESLAVIAYKQPISKATLEGIRGVQCAPTLKTLLDRGLIRIVGREDSLGKPLLYGTTPRFLESFGLPSLDGLPQPELDRGLEG